RESGSGHMRVIRELRLPSNKKRAAAKVRTEEMDSRARRDQRPRVRRTPEVRTGWTSAASGTDQGELRQYGPVRRAGQEATSGASALQQPGGQGESQRTAGMSRSSAA